LVMQQSGESEPFVDEILRSLHRITVDLSPLQVHTFYEAVGYMISAQPNKPTQERLISKLMEMPNNAWDALMAQAASNVDVLGNTENIKIMSNILKTNVAACASIGSFFLPQVGRIFLDMLGLYKAVSGIINEEVAKSGLIATKTPKVRALRTIKKEILKLMESYIKKAEDLDAIHSNFIPPLLEAILGDYNRNVPAARDAEVLNVMGTVTNRLGPLLIPQVPAILDAVFEPTLNMINQEFSEYPEHRAGFYKLIRSINLHCFPALLTIPPAQFRLFMDSIIWGIKHTMRDIADLGLNLALELVNNFANGDTAVANAFFGTFYLSLLQDIFYVLTDTDHKSGFKLQTMVLARLFQLVESGQMQAPIFDPASVPDPNVTNAVYVSQYTMDLLSNAFPHIQQSQIRDFVRTLGDSTNDLNRFKSAVRDFLIQLKEFSAGDNAELYIDEKEAAEKQKAAQDREAAAKIPGMLKPSQIEDKDEI